MLNENKFFSFVPIDSTLALSDDDNLVEVEMLRVGKFNHPVHGELNITDELLESMVDNFNNNVLRRDVSFDWNHNQKEASAWLKGLEVIDGVLVGTFKFTPKGKESIENEEYGYFSVEFLDNYVDAETEEEFGPTLTGGALTNRPFITNLKKIEFECPEIDGPLYRLEEEKHMEKGKKTIKREPVVDDFEIKLEEMNKEKKALEEQIAKLEKQLEESKSSDKKLEEVLGVVKTLEDANKKLSEDIKTLQEENKVANSKSRTLEVETKCAKYISEQGHHPSVVAVAKEIMLASDPKAKVIKLSETIGEGEEEKTIEHEYNMDEAIEKMLEAIPESQRANYEEKTKTKLSDEVVEEAEKVGMQRSFEKAGIKPKHMKAA